MLKNFVALITGVESPFARATAIRLAKKGSTVVLCDSSASQGEQIAHDIGENVSFMPANLTDGPDVQKALKQIESKYGGLNLLLNCPTRVLTPTRTFDFESDSPACLEGFADSLKDAAIAYNTARLAIGLMNKNRPNDQGLRGLIIFTASMEGRHATLGETASAANSGAIIAMTNPCAKDVGPRGIRVVTIVTENDAPQNTQNTDKLRLIRPDEYAQVVQTIIANEHINSTIIELPARYEL